MTLYMKNIVFWKWKMMIYTHLVWLRSEAPHFMEVQKNMKSFVSWL